MGVETWVRDAGPHRPRADLGRGPGHVEALINGFAAGLFPVPLPHVAFGDPAQ